MFRGAAIRGRSVFCSSMGRIYSVLEVESFQCVSLMEPVHTQRSKPLTQILSKTNKNIIARSI